MSKPYAGENTIQAIIKNIKNSFASITHNHDDTYDSKGSASAVQTNLNKFGGTVEITSEEPNKEETVLTVNPEAEEINVYSAEEVDAKFDTPECSYIILKSSVEGSEKKFKITIDDAGTLLVSSF